MEPRTRLRAKKKNSTGPGELLKKLLPLLVTLSASVVGLIGSFTDFKTPSLFRTREEVQIDRLSKKLDQLEQRINQVNSALQTRPAKVTPGESVTSPDIQALSQQVRVDTEAIHEFQQLIMTEPERVISLPLMRRDVQGVRDDLANVKENVKNLSGLVTESSSQNRWVIGTLALGMLALVIPAVRSLFSGGLKGEPKKEEPAV